jgi:hypothetical protein
MVVGPMQCFLVVVLITGFIGLSRGWMREIITMAIILGSVLFLLNGGDGLLHQFFFVNMPTALHDLIFGTSTVTVSAPDPVPNTTTDYLFGLGSFAGLTGLGYLVGHRYGTAPKTNQHRLTGILPGIINGAAISYYASNTILPSTTLDLTSPSDAMTRVYLPIVLGIGLAGMILILIISRISKGGK